MNQTIPTIHYSVSWEKDPRTGKKVFTKLPDPLLEFFNHPDGLPSGLMEGCPPGDYEIEITIKKRKPKTLTNFFNLL